MSNLPIFFLSALVAETIGTFTGFGATTILLPIAALLFPLREAIVYVGLFHFFGTAFRTLFFARGINWKIALLFGVPSLVFSSIGALLLSVISPSIVSKILGISLIVYSVNSLFFRRLKLPATPAVLVSGGATTGFLAGLVGTAGALRGAFLTSWNLSKAAYLGTGAVMGLGADAARAYVYWRTNLIHTTPAFILGLLIIALLGTTLGRKFVQKTPSQLFSRIILIALLLAGLRFLIS